MQESIAAKSRMQCPPKVDTCPADIDHPLPPGWQPVEQSKMASTRPSLYERLSPGSPLPSLKNLDLSIVASV